MFGKAHISNEFCFASIFVQIMRLICGLILPWGDQTHPAISFYKLHFCTLLPSLVVFFSGRWHLVIFMLYLPTVCEVEKSTFGQLFKKWSKIALSKRQKGSVKFCKKFCWKKKKNSETDSVGLPLPSQNSCWINNCDSCQTSWLQKAKSVPHYFANTATSK